MGELELQDKIKEEARELRKIIGTNVKYYRLRSGISQVNLAKTLGKSVFTLSSIERGIHNTTVVTLMQIAKVLKVSCVTLLCGEDDIILKKSKIIASLSVDE